MRNWEITFLSYFPQNLITKSSDSGYWTRKGIFTRWPTQNYCSTILNCLLSCCSFYHLPLFCHLFLASLLHSGIPSALLLILCHRQDLIQKPMTRNMPLCCFWTCSAFSFSSFREIFALVGVFCLCLFFWVGIFFRLGARRYFVSSMRLTLSGDREYLSRHQHQFSPFVRLVP